MFHVSSFTSFERPFLRAGQAVKSVRPENKFLAPCEHSLTLSLTMQKYESFIAVLECCSLFLKEIMGNRGHLVMVIWSKSKTDCQNPPL